MSTMDMSESSNWTQQHHYPLFSNNVFNAPVMHRNFASNNAAPTTYIPSFNWDHITSNSAAMTPPPLYGNCFIDTCVSPYGVVQLQQSYLNQIQPENQNLSSTMPVETTVWQNNPLLQYYSQSNPEPQGFPLNLASGCQSSLAVRCLQMAMTDLKQSNVCWEDRSADTCLSHHNTNSFGSLPLESPLVPTRKYGSTCIAGQYRNEHYGLPRSRTSRTFFSTHENDKIGSEVLCGAYQRCEPWCDRISTPTGRKSFCADTVANDRAQRYLNLLHHHGPPSNKQNKYDCPGLISEQDLKWKVLNEKIVKESFEKADSCWKPPQTVGNFEPYSTSSDSRSIFSESNDYRNREPATMWSWARRIQSTGPPFKRHLDDEGPVQNNNNRFMPSGKVTEFVANLPGRFTYKHDFRKTQKRCVSSTHADLKKEVETLYKNFHSKAVSSLQSHEKIPPAGRTSPVFSPKSKSTCATQTDRMRDDKTYFIRRFERLNQNVQKDNEHFDDVVNGAGSVSSMEDSVAEKFSESPPLQVYTSGVKLSRKDYYCLPSLATLDRKTNQRNGLCIVENFEVGHIKHGKVVFRGFTNVAGLDLDKIVVFHHKSLHLYPNYTDMPRFGEGLHRPCTVTIFNVWPESGDGQANSGDAPNVIYDLETIEEMGFEAILRTMCKQMNAKFLDYSPESGEWTFMAQL